MVPMEDIDVAKGISEVTGELLPSRKVFIPE
jgi:hypothetical protein